MKKKYIIPTIVVEKTVLLTNIQENSGVATAITDQMTKSRDSFDEKTSGQDEKEYGEIQSTIW